MTQWPVIATFDMMPDAHIALGLLKSENIPCYLQDENLVQTDWLYSIAVGGIKLRVPQAYVEQACGILSGDFSQNLDSSE